MSRIAYVNGRYVPHADAAVHIEDRGYQFADGVYEVCEIWDGRLVDETRHLDRLERSLRELAIRMPMGRAALKVVLREVVRRNRVRDGLVYLQVTRGVARRDHAFPAAGHAAGARRDREEHRRARRATAWRRRASAVITLPDNRWERVDIKIGRPAAECARQAEGEGGGAREAWFVDRDGFVTEGASTTAWIVTKDGALVTRPNGTDILPGITRITATEVARRAGAEGRGAEVHGRGGEGGARGLHDGREHASSCRSCRIDGDAGRRTASPARSRRSSAPPSTTWPRSSANDAGRCPSARGAGRG